MPTHHIDTHVSRVFGVFSLHKYKFLLIFSCTYDQLHNFKWGCGRDKTGIKGGWRNGWVEGRVKEGWGMWISEGDVELPTSSAGVKKNTPSRRTSLLFRRSILAQHQKKIHSSPQFWDEFCLEPRVSCICIRSRPHPKNNQVCVKIWSFNPITLCNDRTGLINESWDRGVVGICVPNFNFRYFSNLGSIGKIKF